jgi:hypothetical protein
MQSPEYSKYMNRARLDKAVNTLLGILQGMAMDLKISGSEVALLSNCFGAKQKLPLCAL